MGFSLTTRCLTNLRSKLHLPSVVLLISTISSATNASAQVAGEIEYGYWGNALRSDLTEAVSRAFEADNPGSIIQGTIAEYNSYIERLSVQAAAGDLPCITQAQGVFIATFATNNVLLPLDGLIAAGKIDVSGVQPAIMETGRVEGKIYMIPTGFYAQLPVYNRAMAEQYGIGEPPKGGFDELKTWLLDAQEKLPDGIYAIENDGFQIFTFYNWLAGHNAQFFDGQQLSFEPALLAEYIQFWEDLRKAGAALPADRIDEQGGAYETKPMARGQAMVAFRDASQVAQTEDTLASSNLPAEIVILTNPIEDGAVSGNVPGANGLTISASCDNVDLAAAYINFFLNDPKAALAFQSVNGIVTSKSAQDALLNSPDTTSKVRRAIETSVTLQEEGDLAPATYPAGYQALANPFKRAYESVALAGEDPMEASERFFAEAKRALR